MEPLILTARKNYHKLLLSERILTVDSSGVPSNADKDSKLSIAIAKGLAGMLLAETGDKIMGQTSGAKFEAANMEFLNATFPRLGKLRPGK